MDNMNFTYCLRPLIHFRKTHGLITIIAKHKMSIQMPITSFHELINMCVITMPILAIAVHQYNMRAV